MLIAYLIGLVLMIGIVVVAAALAKSAVVKAVTGLSEKLVR